MSLVQFIPLQTKDASTGKWLRRFIVWRKPLVRRVDVYLQLEFFKQLAQGNFQLF